MSIEVSAPESLDDIKLRQYMEFLLIEDPTSKDVIRVFLNLPESIVGKVPFVEVERVSSMILAMFEEQTNLHGVFKMNGKEFGFIPQIDIASYDEKTDIELHISDWQNMHRAMAVMYRPVTNRKKDKYLTEDYEGSDKYAEEMLDAPLSVVLGAIVFFYNIANDLLNYIPNYLQGEMTRQNLSSLSGEDTTNILHSLTLLKNQLTLLGSVPLMNVTTD